MGAEAGQSLDDIIKRKESERIDGNGTFLWGIGNSLGSRFWNFIDINDNPKVIFSPMKSIAKFIDSNPSKIIKWSSYVGQDDIINEMPPNWIVTSKGMTNNKPKTSHYALVCKSVDSLLNQHHPSINSKTFRNFNRGTVVGSSQITSIVEVLPDNTELLYPVSFIADLTYPFFVKLINPV